MADGSSDAVESATLEGAAATWLAERAEEVGVSSDEFLERIVAAYRAAEAGEPPGDVVSADRFQRELAALREDVEGDVEAVDEEFSEKLQDVRDRVIQVKREADAKAAADHDHPELDDRLGEAVAAVEDVEAAVADVGARVERLSRRLDAGFDNFEEVLTFLRDETDALDRKASKLAAAVLSMREAVGAVAAANARRERTDRLKREANRKNVRVADCGACGSETSVGLLTAPECPACGTAFEGVEANEGWFGSHTLLSGAAPALEAPGQPGEDEVEDWLGADADTLEDIVEGGDGDDAAAPDAVGGDAGETDDVVDAESVGAAEESAPGDATDAGDATDDQSGGDGEWAVDDDVADVLDEDPVDVPGVDDPDDDDGDGDTNA